MERAFETWSVGLFFGRFVACFRWLAWQSEPEPALNGSAVFRTPLSARRMSLHVSGRKWNVGHGNVIHQGRPQSGKERDVKENMAVQWKKGEETELKWSDKAFQTIRICGSWHWRLHMWIVPRRVVCRWENLAEEVNNASHPIILGRNIFVVGSWTCGIHCVFWWIRHVRKLICQFVQAAKHVCSFMVWHRNQKFTDDKLWQKQRTEFLETEHKKETLSKRQKMRTPKIMKRCADKWDTHFQLKQDNSWKQHKNPTLRRMRKQNCRSTRHHTVAQNWTM